MAGRPCKICADSEKARIAAQMITQGATDEAVATGVGGVSRVSVHRHRVNQIQPLARAVADAVGKGMPARKEREKALAAAERGEIDPAAFLSVAQLTEDQRFRATVYAMNTLLLAKGIYTAEEFRFQFRQSAQKQLRKKKS